MIKDRIGPLFCRKSTLLNYHPYSLENAESLFPCQLFLERETHLQMLEYI